MYLRTFSKRSHKYNAASCKCYSGHIHDSRLEARVCDRLLAMVQGGEIESYERQVNFDLLAYGIKICAHRVDYVLTHKNNSLEVWEVKGYATPEWRIKKKLFEANYPHIKYTVVVK